jgi:hypothetical protein
LEANGASKVNCGPLGSARASALRFRTIVTGFDSTLLACAMVASP